MPKGGARLGASRGFGDTSGWFEKSGAQLVEIDRNDCREGEHGEELGRACCAGLDLPQGLDREGGLTRDTFSTQAQVLPGAAQSESELLSPTRLTLTESRTRHALTILV
jgi:hypothetical protein